jgi:hypothetical protein
MYTCYYESIPTKVHPISFRQFPQYFVLPTYTCIIRVYEHVLWVVYVNSLRSLRACMCFFGNIYACMRSIHEKNYTAHLLVHVTCFYVGFRA